MSIFPGRAVYGQQFFVCIKQTLWRTNYIFMYVPGFQKSKREEKAALSWGWFFLTCLELSHNAGRCLYSNLHKVSAGYSPLSLHLPQAAALSPRMVWFYIKRVMVCDPLSRRLLIPANLPVLCPPSPSHHTSYVAWEFLFNSYLTKINVSVAPCVINNMKFH